MILKNMVTDAPERVKGGCPWEIRPEKRGGKTIKLCKSHVYMTLSK